MTDNYNNIYEYMHNLGIVNTKDEAMKSDLFFDIQLIRRGKDHPNMPAANYTFKTYYFDSLEMFSKSYDEIKKCCEIFGLRAYVSVNVKSKQEAAKKTLEKYAHNIVTNEYTKPWKDFSSICGGLKGKTKRWVIDCDDTNSESNYIKEISRIITTCDSEYANPIVTTIKTKSGIHLITNPFNIKQFKNLCNYNGLEIPAIQLNHMTLLYENL